MPQSFNQGMKSRGPEHDRNMPAFAAPTAKAQSSPATIGLTNAILQVGLPVDRLGIEHGLLVAGLRRTRFTEWIPHRVGSGWLSTTTT